MSKKKILVTSALPYANGPIHIGHLAGAYLPADVYVRYNRMKKNDVLFIGGSDEHGVAITIAAEEQKISPQKIIDKFHNENYEAFKKAGISFDNYSRTSLPVHHKTAQEVFTKIYEKGFLEKKNIKQLYCEKCNLFLADRYVEGECPSCNTDGARGDQCESCGKWLEPSDLIEPRCKICGSKPVIKETFHFFLKMGAFQEQIQKWIESKKNWKDNVSNFCNNWFKKGLNDRPITRDLNWGIKVPLKDAENKVLYVWFEAPIGYISSTKEWAEKQGNPDLWKEYWRDENTKIVHFIGKDNIVFHAIVWPIILAASDYAKLPDEIPANEFLNIAEKKISTSKHYAIWLKDIVRDYNPDSLRYAIAVNAPENRDTDFSWEYFQLKNNNELAANIGNFVNRALTFVHRYFNGLVPEPQNLSEIDKQILEDAKKTRQKLSNLFKIFSLKEAAKTFMSYASKANKYFNDKAPWHSQKKDLQDCANTLYTSIQIVKDLAQLMFPIMPFTAEKIWQMLNLENKCEDTDWDTIAESENLIKPQHKINKTVILFKKIENKEIKKELEKLNPKEKKENTDNVLNINQIEFDDFIKIKLKVAEIIEAEKIKKSKKLLKLKIKIGEETRPLVAGIALYYSPENLIGKKIIVVSNLKPAKLMGEISQGMLLAAKSGENLTLITPEKDIESGADVS